MNSPRSANATCSESLSTCSPSARDPQLTTVSRWLDTRTESARSHREAAGTSGARRPSSGSRPVQLQRERAQRSKPSGTGALEQQRHPVQPTSLMHRGAGCSAGAHRELLSRFTLRACGPPGCRRLEVPRGRGCGVKMKGLRVGGTSTVSVVSFPAFEGFTTGAARAAQLQPRPRLGGASSKGWSRAAAPRSRAVSTGQQHGVARRVRRVEGRRRSGPFVPPGSVQGVSRARVDRLVQVPSAS